jgi:hypothetical protein
MNGKEFIIERRRVKHARIIVNRQLQVKLVVPRQFTRNQVHELIHEKSAWIEKQLKHFSKIQKARIRLDKGEILYQGEIYRFQLHPDLSSRVVVDLKLRTITSGLNLLNPALLETWCRQAARRQIETKVRTWSRQYGFQYNRLTVRGQKTRWGSCSSKGNLSFNWKLIKAPEAIMDYIILHELTHTEILNHSPSYWARLSAIYPQYYTAKNWLKANSWLLD